MQIEIGTSWIIGVMFGLEAMPKFHCEEMDITWGIVIDIACIRVSIIGYKEKGP